MFFNILIWPLVANNKVVNIFFLYFNVFTITAKLEFQSCSLNTRISRASHLLIHFCKMLLTLNEEKKNQEKI